MDENNNGLLKKKKTVYSLNAGAVMTHIQWLCNEPEMQPKVTLTQLAAWGCAKYHQEPMTAFFPSTIAQ